MRDRKLAEMMGICWHDNQGWPDFSYPEWRARLMDFCVEQEWFPRLLEHAFNRCSIDSGENVNSFEIAFSREDTFYTYEIFTYLWRNLPDLIVEYRGLEK